ncbi:prepilin-type N-terminal cleavage/methylation domain-containing protein [Enterobacter sp. UPMP2060]|nr:prepilin-type N-terminal cleavage/methylation domain-containing protein [Enterobacter asburiae]
MDRQQGFTLIELMVISKVIL